MNLNQKVLNKIKTGKVLDIGCGSGEDSVFFAKHNFSVTGIDISKQAIHDSMQLSKIEGKSIDFVNINFFDFNSDKYDLIICKGVLHFVDDKTNFIKKMQQITNKNGINMVTALNVDLKKYYSNWEILFEKVEGKENILIAKLK